MHRYRFWTWLKTKNNQDLVKMGGAALAAIIAAGWAVFTFVADHHVHEGVSATHGSIAAGHDATGNKITYTEPLTATKP